MIKFVFKKDCKHVKVSKYKMNFNRYLPNSTSLWIWLWLLQSSLKLFTLLDSNIDVWGVLMLHCRMQSAVVWCWPHSPLFEDNSTRHHNDSPLMWSDSWDSWPSPEMILIRYFRQLLHHSNIVTAAGWSALYSNFSRQIKDTISMFSFWFFLPPTGG